MTGRKTTHDVKGARQDKSAVVEDSSRVVCLACAFCKARQATVSSRSHDRNHTVDHLLRDVFKPIPQEQHPLRPGAQWKRRALLHRW